MLDTAIVGGGLCGLALARGLESKGRDYVLFEARDRLGGRVLSVPSATAGTALDLGPTWFWPDIHPRMAHWVAELGLSSFPQHDGGEVLGLKEADGKIESLGSDPVHNGARRVAGGMAALIDAVAAPVPPERIKAGHVLARLEDRGDHVALHFQAGDATTVVEARRVVLAIPPRVVEERIAFEPPLGEDARAALQETPTWMAGEAKAVVAYPKAFWREAGKSGNGFARHEQAALGELFDACGAEPDQAALGGFVALSPQNRAAFKDGMPMLVQSQLVQFFGNEAETGEFHYQDWAAEPHTCATLDLERPDQHPEYANPRLTRPYWAGKLLFGSSETARYGGGYLEGALEAAHRLQEQLPALPAESNREPVERFSAWVATQRAGALDRYQKHLNHNLASQQRDQLTQRSLLETVEGLYREALVELDGLALDSRDVAVVNGRSDLTPPLLTPFMGFNEALIEAAVKFNQASCALSNFPVEHSPDAAYVQTIRRDLNAAWREFALAVNDRLLPATPPNLRLVDA